MAQGEDRKNKHVKHYRHYHFKPTYSNYAFRANTHKNKHPANATKLDRIIIIVTIIIIFKISHTGPSGKNNLFINYFRNPKKHLRHGKLKTTQLREVTNGWLHPWTHPAFRCQTQCWKGHSAFEPGPAGNTLQNWKVLHLHAKNSNGFL